MPHLLSLFSGTRSIEKGFADAGWTIESIDIDGRFGARVCDIRKWDYTQAAVPDVIWAGVPCENYSRARTTAKLPRNFALADELVRVTTEIIAYFLERAPHCLYFVENPDSSLMWGRGVAAPLQKHVRLDYCCYSKPFRKRTRLGTNSDYQPRPLCNPKTCPACPNGKNHMQSAQQGPQKVGGIRLATASDKFTRDYLHAYPEELAQEIFEYCQRQTWHPL